MYYKDVLIINTLGYVKLTPVSKDLAPVIFLDAVVAQGFIVAEQNKNDIVIVNEGAV